MLLLEVGLLLLLLMASSLGPGLFFVRRLSWGRLETLTASIALSHFLIFAAAMLIFVFRAPSSIGYGVTAASVFLTLWCRRDIVQLLRDERSRCALLVWGGLFLWLMLVAINIRHYSGGGWYGDWYGHFDRVVFFARSDEVITKYTQTVGGLPARPPLMNVLAAHFLSQIELRFELFQVAFLYLNSLAFFGAALFTSKRSKRSIVVLGILLALTPFFVQNTTYTWTKLYAAFFVLTGLALYWSGLRMGDMTRTVAAFAVLAMGLITHYSAGPYVVLLTLHYLCFEWYWRRRRLLEVTTIFLVALLILSTWFVWSIASYGLEETLTANTSAQGFAVETVFQSLGKILYNIYTALVPGPLRGATYPDWGVVEPKLAQLRDIFFMVFQYSFPGMFGVTAWLAAAWLLVRDDSVSAEERRRWIVFGVLAFVLGVAVYGTPNRYGMAHITHQPIVLLGICWIANGWDRLPPALRKAVIVGKGFDVGIGIVLQTWLQRIDFWAMGPRPRTMLQSAAELGPCALGNFALQLKNRVVFLGDSLTAVSPFLMLPLVGLPMVVLWYAYPRSRRGRKDAAAHRAPLARSPDEERAQ